MLDEEEGVDNGVALPLFDELLLKLPDFDVLTPAQVDERAWLQRVTRACRR